MTTMLAQLQPDMNWPATLKFIVGLVGLLMIIWLVFSVAIAWKKLFGRRPPISEEIAKLETKVHQQVLESYEGAYKAADEAKAQVALVRAELRVGMDKQDLRIAEIWNEMRKEDRDIRKEARDSNEKLSGVMAEGFNTVSRALGRIEGAQK